MSKAVAPYHARRVARFAFAGVTAALLAGCAETSRFTGDPLGNPFHTASTDRAPTGSLEPRPGQNMGADDMRDKDMAPPPYRHTAVASRPLAAPADAPRRVASYEAPVRERTTSSAYVAPSGHGTWSSSGGMSVTVASGESANVLAARYNVPADALVRANGFSSSADIRPGTRLIIPVYTAGARVAVESMPARDHAGRKQLAKAIIDRRVSDREVAHRAKLEADRQAAAEQVAEREAAHRRLAKQDETGTMHWKRGAQPARMGEADPHAQRKAEIEDKRGRRAEREAEATSRKSTQAEERKTKAAEARQMKLDARQARLDMQKDKAAAAAPEKPRHMAKAEAAPAREETVAPRKAQSDPTPTASLPPAAEEKVASSNGGPEFRWPARGRIIQGFKSGGNDGINIAVPDGTAVKAAESGVVAYAGNEIKGFGNLVLIRHPNGFVSAYANNGGISVKRGEQVKRGQTIATSGQSGNVASPQLHFELRKGSTPVDPTRYLAGL